MVQSLALVVVEFLPRLVQNLVELGMVPVSFVPRRAAAVVFVQNLIGGPLAPSRVHDWLLPPDFRPVSVRWSHHYVDLDTDLRDLLLIRFRQRYECGINVAASDVEFDAVGITGLGEQSLGLVYLRWAIERRAILIARPNRVITGHDAAVGAQNKSTRA